MKNRHLVGTSTTTTKPAGCAGSCVPTATACSVRRRTTRSGYAKGRNTWSGVLLEQGNVQHARAIAKAAGTFFNPECDHVISRQVNGRLLGGVIFTGYTGASIGLHVAGFDPNWINRDILWLTFSYPFSQLNCAKITGTIPSSNLAAVRFNEKLGFVEETRVKDVFPDGDLIIMSMRREDCRWLKRGSRGK